jgi:hypothetical protein
VAQGTYKEGIVPAPALYSTVQHSTAQFHIQMAAATCSFLQGLAGALTRGTVLPALHVVTALLLAALMGSFNTQTYLDLNTQ